MVVDRICDSCKIVIDGLKLQVDLHILSVKDYDVILGMDWLSSSHILVDCHEKIVDFKIQRETEFTFFGSDSVLPPNVVSALQA